MPGRVRSRQQRQTEDGESAVGQGGGSGTSVPGASLPGCSWPHGEGSGPLLKETTRDKVGARTLPHEVI